MQPIPSQWQAGIQASAALPYAAPTPKITEIAAPKVTAKVNLDEPAEVDDELARLLEAKKKRLAADDNAEPQPKVQKTENDAGDIKKASIFDEADLMFELLGMVDGMESSSTPPAPVAEDRKAPAEEPPPPPEPSGRQEDAADAPPPPPAEEHPPPPPSPEPASDSDDGTPTPATRSPSPAADPTPAAEPAPAASAAPAGWGKEEKKDNRVRESWEYIKRDNYGAGNFFDFNKF